MAKKRSLTQRADDFLMNIVIGDPPNMDEFRESGRPITPSEDTDEQMDMVTAGDDEIITEMEREEAIMADKKKGGDVLDVFDKLKAGGAPRENVKGVNPKEMKKKKKKKKVGPDDISMPVDIGKGQY